ncbi:hypothetical protein L7F22_050816 [Adiantum nelumboides]|nr:hypothetical protein [Adiantum nelumboides]
MSKVLEPDSRIPASADRTAIAAPAVSNVATHPPLHFSWTKPVEWKRIHVPGGVCSVAEQGGPAFPFAEIMSSLKRAKASCTPPGPASHPHPGQTLSPPQGKELNGTQQNHPVDLKTDPALGRLAYEAPSSCNGAKTDVTTSRPTLPLICDLCCVIVTFA